MCYKSIINTVLIVNQNEKNAEKSQVQTNVYEK